MASSKEYLEFILGQLSELEEITYRAMMVPTAPYELPYEGAKEMLLVDEVDNKEFLTCLFHAMYDELPAPKQKKKK